jgi:hypothetical protein
MMDPAHTLTLSALGVAMVDALAHHEHFPTALLIPESICCRICGVVWSTPEAWAEDNGYCPGYVQCGQDPALTQPLSIGPLGEEG